MFVAAMETMVFIEEFVVDHQWDIKDFILNLEDSSTIPEVKVNGNKVCRESESYLSFLLDLSKVLHLGENQVEVKKTYLPH